MFPNTDRKREREKEKEKKTSCLTSIGQLQNLYVHLQCQKEKKRQWKKIFEVIMVENFLKTDTILEMQVAQRLQSKVKIKKKINKKHKVK